MGLEALYHWLLQAGHQGSLLALPSLLPSNTIGSHILVAKQYHWPSHPAIKNTIGSHILLLRILLALTSCYQEYYGSCHTVL